MKEQERIKKENVKRERRLIREQNITAMAKRTEMKKLNLKAKKKRNEDKKQRGAKAERERIRKEMQAKIDAMSSWR